MGTVVPGCQAHRPHQPEIPGGQTLRAVCISVAHLPPSCPWAVSDTHGEWELGVVVEVRSSRGQELAMLRFCKPLVDVRWIDIYTPSDLRKKHKSWNPRIWVCLLAKSPQKFIYSLQALVSSIYKNASAVRLLCR